ncbi:hypothetical protein BHQ21_09615 [Mycobacterium sherrisii]|uniref:Uncharacterized protein n=1 Tax=Mycobacterium sherrisii TaxID=243061 RepID=A0A1E3SYU3_9MYCO|nr:hypothetical protein [Mycobacterium sherrisii]ODR07301.1 hypothetical protein BHQ21_09615 [Mycobacterium sherrisii]
MAPEDTLDNLPWFHRLTMDEQVHLLTHPTGTLPQELINKLKLEPGVLSWSQWENNPPQVTLAADAITTLTSQRRQLDTWFDHLSPEDRDYFIEHRNGRLSKEYLHKADAASGPALSVLINSDATDGYRFELTPFLRIYLEYCAQ